MNKIEFNKKSILCIVLGLVGLALFILSLITYIKSFWFEDYGEYGSEFGFDQDSVYLLLSSLILVCFSVYGVFNNSYALNSCLLGGCLFNGILMCNYLGTFLKQMLRDEPKPFADYKMHLIYGIITLVVCVGCAFAYYKLFCAKKTK